MQLLKFGICFVGSYAWFALCSVLTRGVLRWACIALTTLLIRSATIPLLMNQLRATVKLNVKCS